MKHERRVVGHASGWKEQMNTCVCGKPWPCPELEQRSSKERANFERWLVDNHWTTKRDPYDRERYQTDTTQVAWQAWQARAADEPRAGYDLRALLSEIDKHLDYSKDTAIYSGSIFHRTIKEQLARAAEPPSVATKFKPGDRVKLGARSDVYDVLNVYPMYGVGVAGRWLMNCAEHDLMSPETKEGSRE